MSPSPHGVYPLGTRRTIRALNSRVQGGGYGAGREHSTHWRGDIFVFGDEMQAELGMSCQTSSSSGFGHCHPQFALLQRLSMKGRCRRRHIVVTGGLRHSRAAGDSLFPDPIWAD